MPALGLDGMETAEVYELLMCAVVPRPIALVTTVSANASVNAAPFSSFVVLTPKPPTLGFVIGGWEGRRKDTRLNIEARGEFVINVVAQEMAEAVELCAVPLDHGESEIALSGLTLMPSHHVSVPRVAEAPIAFECRLERFLQFGDAPDTLVAGRIVGAHAADGVVEGSRIDPRAWRPLARVGGGAFCELSEPFKVRKAPRGCG